MSTKVAVCTVILPHGYKQLRPPLYTNWSVHYWVISDKFHIIPPWRDHVVTRDHVLSSRRDFQQYKLLLHEYFPRYDWVIWQDANIQLKVDPLYLVELLKASGKSIGFVEHFHRDCAYEEAKVCLGFGSVDPDITAAQLQRYRELGFPERFGLVESGFFIRSNRDPDVIRLTERWYAETMAGCCKNQISFPFASWIEDVPYWTIPWEILDPELSRGKSDIWQNNKLFRRNR